MERVTFPTAEVQQALAKIERVRLDIDDAGNAAAVRRYGESAVPTFALVDGDGNLVHRWVGGSDAEGFVAELDQALAEHADPDQRSRREVLDRLLVTLLRGDADATDPDLLWAACERAASRGDWPALAAATARYLTLPDAPQHARVQALAGVATFETTGEVTVALQERIDELIAVLDRPFPGSSLAERAARLLGRARPVNEAAAEAWVDEANDSMEALGHIGAAAAPSLLQAMQKRPLAAYDCATVLARLRLPTTTTLLQQALAGRLPTFTRVAMIACIANHNEQRCLPILLEHAAPHQPTGVRQAAMWGVRDLLFQLGGSDRQDVADVVGAALQSRHAGLLSVTMQVAIYVQAPLPLDVLDDLLDDDRSIWRERTIADDALWILGRQLGLEVVDEDDTRQVRAEPDVVACVRTWLADHQDRLRWSPAGRRYQVMDRR